MEHFYAGVEKGNSKEMFHANLSTSIVGLVTPEANFKNLGISRLRIRLVETLLFPRTTLPIDYLYKIDCRCLLGASRLF